MNGCQTPLLGVSCVPSVAKENWGFGRRNEVISWACISSTAMASALSAGLSDSNFALTCSQVRLCCPETQTGTRLSATATAVVDSKVDISFIHDLTPRSARRTKEGKTRTGI